MFFWDYTMILLIPGLLLGIWAQAKMQSAFSKYSSIPTHLGQPAGIAVHELLNQQGLGSVSVQHIKGHLTDHYDPRSNVLRLSSSVYGSDSIAALGVAAHEAGHALQKQQNYPLLALRSLMVPVVNIGSQLSWPVFLLGLVFSWQPLMIAGIVLFSAVLLFSLVTLPVEFDASRRAAVMLASSRMMTEEEVKGVRVVLRAAALTYVASFVSVVMQLLRLILIARAHDDD